MENFVLYHNPRCSKSRATLALLEENNISPEIIFCLENAPDVDQLKMLLDKLNLGVRDILRKPEPEYEALGLDDASLADEVVLDILSNHPVLLQRPIVISGDEAIIGRPPENVLRLIEA